MTKIFDNVFTIALILGSILGVLIIPAMILVPHFVLSFISTKVVAVLTVIGTISLVTTLIATKQD